MSITCHSGTEVNFIRTTILKRNKAEREQGTAMRHFEPANIKSLFFRLYRYLAAYVILEFSKKTIESLV